AAAFVAEADTRAVHACLTTTVAAAGAHALTLGPVVARVADVAGGEALCGEAVLAIVDRLIRAGDRCSLQVGVDADLEAIVAGQNAALSGDALVVAVDLAVRGIDAAADLARAH
ncbi:hypothetical protein L195_g061651, partial [Trifolium pratense]